LRNSKVKELAKLEGRSVKDILISLYERHGSQTAVAYELGVSQSRLSQLIKENQLKEKRILVLQEQVS